MGFLVLDSVLVLDSEISLVRAVASTAFEDLNKGFLLKLGKHLDSGVEDGMSLYDIVFAMVKLARAKLPDTQIVLTI